MRQSQNKISLAAIAIIMSTCPHIRCRRMRRLTPANHPERNLMCRLKQSLNAQSNPSP